MFSKALFKQSCKANGAMWGVITFAVCFMLACVMLISGSGNLGETKDAIQNTIITKEVDSQMESRSINYYLTAKDGLYYFDKTFTEESQAALSYYTEKFVTWKAKEPSRSDYSADEEYNAAVEEWLNGIPEAAKAGEKQLLSNFSAWYELRPARSAFSSDEEYNAAVTEWKKQDPTAFSLDFKCVFAASYAASCKELQSYLGQVALSRGYTENSDGYLETVGCVMALINPPDAEKSTADKTVGMFDYIYEQSGEEVFTYDYVSLCLNVHDDEYVDSDERREYAETAAGEQTAIFLASNMTGEKSRKAMLEALKSYNVSEEQYDSFGYNYANIKHLARSAVSAYAGRYEYEAKGLEDKFAAGEITQDEYNRKIAELKNEQGELINDVAGSLLSTLPETVADALKEVGELDLYSLIVGSIFYKLAGLLLPIIYMIMASNNLISGQVDSGSMAYVLSTSTMRSTVAFTQAVYLVGSIFATFVLTTLTGFSCLAIVTARGLNVGLNYLQLLYINIGAFLVLFALSGLCFFTSCFFDRSKRSMAVGGGLSIFALVAAMLGLFGSPIIPSVIRLEALNYFNYVTVISLFDVVSIIDGTAAFAWKFVILLAGGLVGYVLGSLKFVRKDLPL